MIALLFAVSEIHSFLFFAKSVWQYNGVEVHQRELWKPGQFRDEEMKKVLLFHELDWLAISNSAITNAALKDIARLKPLGRIDIEGCRVSEKAVEELRRALPNTKVYSDFE